ncbi:MAG: HEPN/Toprim-associated domain-containing protein, partial [Methyloceanibacter sp.]
KASNATRALNSPVNRRLVVIWYSSLSGGIHLNTLSDFPGPAHKYVLGRLSMLGYSKEKANLAFERMLEDDLPAEATPGNKYVSFEELTKALSELDVSTVGLAYDSEDYNYDPSELPAEEILDRQRLGAFDSKPLDLRAIKQLVKSTHPYWSLILLSDNLSNLDVPVEWGYADIAENFTGREAFLRDLGSELKFLIVTEGSSDANIIRKALTFLRPEIADFFTFVDMEEGYPFTGTGNLYRFCQGLTSIAIQNKVLVIYDNDAEGKARYLDTSKLRLPKDMSVMKLPDHSTFERFATEGPNGSSVDDINGRAAAIECFLDLDWQCSDQPHVRWTSYNRILSAYQGELANKEQYVRGFLELKRRESGYKFDKLSIVLDAIVHECTEIAARDASDFLVEYL